MEVLDHDDRIESGGHRITCIHPDRLGTDFKGDRRGLVGPGGFSGPNRHAVHCGGVIVG
jgi:hypothetical protein